MGKPIKNKLSPLLDSPRLHLLFPSGSNSRLSQLLLSPINHTCSNLSSSRRRKSKSDLNLTSSNLFLGLPSFDESVECATPPRRSMSHLQHSHSDRFDNAIRRPYLQRARSGDQRCSIQSVCLPVCKYPNPLVELSFQIPFKMLIVFVVY